MTKANSEKNIWVIIPASGIGSRMQSSIPKQYLPFQHKTVIEITLDRLLNCDHICGAVVVISEGDSYWSTLDYSHSKPVIITKGASERSGSVLNGLKVLKSKAEQSNVWVMIHDAVRPCITHTDLDKLVEASAVEEQGLFLAHPVADTLKKADVELRSIQTVDRSSLWKAFTPQMFPYDLIRHALQQVTDDRIPITDDVSAIEAIGMNPKIILGRSDNIKITYPQDIVIAEIINKNNDL